MPSQLDVIFGFGVGLIGFVMVTAAARGLVKAYLGNPIPYGTRRELEGKYGHWAVDTAIAVCPRDDTRCIEREAKRLYESRLRRRF